MKITLNSSKYLKKINKIEAIKNLFDFNLGSALTEILDVDYSIEMKAFLLLFNTSRNTNLQISKSYGKDQLNKEYDLVAIANEFQKEYKNFLEQEITITKDFFENILKHDNGYLIASYNLFKRFCDQLEIKLPKDIRYIYYVNFRENLAEEFQNYQERYEELIEFFNNPISLQNDKFSHLLNNYNDFKNHYTKPLQDRAGTKEALNDLYIEPTFSIHKNNLKNIEEKDEYKDFHNFSDIKTIHDYFGNFFLLNKKHENLNENYNMAFVLGQPGQGKTSFCYKLVYDYLEKYSDLPQIPMIFVKIRDLVAKDFVNDPLREVEKRFNFVDFNNDELVLVLDGLDEAYMSGGITDDDLRNLYDRLKKRANNKVKIILTSRFNYLNTYDACLDKTLILHLNNLNDQQIIKYCDKFKKFHPNNLFVRNIDLIIEQNQYKHIKELLRQAVLIYFIAISDINIDEKDSKAVIYDKIFDSLAQRSWDSNGQLEYINPKIKANSKLYKSYLREYIRSIAFEIYKSPKLYITVEKLLELESTKLFITRCFTKDLLASEEKLKEISKYLLISFYFQQSNRDNSDTALEFFHNSLWEFLTAEYFWEENKNILLQKDDYEEYKIINQENYFNFIDKIVGNKNFAEFSIKTNLIEIISNENEIIKKDIFTQSITNFQELLSKQFVLRFNFEKNGFTVIEKSFQIFNVFWCFINESNKNLNSPIEFSGNEINYLFRDNKFINNNVSNVILTNNLFGLQFIIESRLENVTFSGGVWALRINKCDLINVKFEDVIFEETVFTNTDVINVKFLNTYFGNKVEFKNMKFDNIIMENINIPDEEWFENFIKNNYFETVFIEKHKIEKRLVVDYENIEKEKFYIVYNDSNI
ncbi:NACHT domain-containing protein [Chryseobacterium sp. C-71]|uniref:NACHT domain-containing protein n=1 Tax=Chryseobacterium sp. C-71 TaxID=2893882 RepID=UPI001E5DF419|nr:NACHT domain-containing protein [Chryseobacterium sp. C-71]UFH33262.1 NACHT domain-containing protein [Chryseobacterium sp. C-71]